MSTLWAKKELLPHMDRLDKSSLDDVLAEVNYGHVSRARAREIQMYEAQRVPPVLAVGRANSL